MKGLQTTSTVLLVIGGLNWLLMGLFSTDVGVWLGGQDTVVAKIIYILVGLAAIVKLFGSKSSAPTV